MTTRKEGSLVLRGLVLYSAVLTHVQAILVWTSDTNAHIGAIGILQGATLFALVVVTIFRSTS